MKDVKIQTRKDYGDTWETLIGPHPIGMNLVAKTKRIHERDKSLHIAVYLDGELNYAFMPNTGLGESPVVTVNGKNYVESE